MTPEELRLLQKAVHEATCPGDNAEAYWEAVRAVYPHGSKEVFAAVARWAESPSEAVRTLVPDVLRALGGKTHGTDPLPFVYETIGVFEEMLRVEQSPSVLAAIGNANVELRSKRLGTLFLPFHNHSDPEVRSAAVQALFCPQTAEELWALIALSRDTTDEVRSWATFFLAQLSETLEECAHLKAWTPQILQALLDRAADTHDETRAEAVLGLAQRGDARAPALVLAGLGGGGPQWLQYLEAATLLREPMLHGDLLRLWEAGWPGPGRRGREELEAALHACRL